MVNLQAMVNIIGIMVAILKETLSMALEMGKDLGKKVLETVIAMMVSIGTIRNGEKELLFGPVVMFIKGNMKLI
jgi:hypothetical protein